MTFDEYRSIVECNGANNGHIRFTFSAKWDYYPATRKNAEFIFYFKTEADMVLAKLAM